MQPTELRDSASQDAPCAVCEPEGAIRRILLVDDEPGIRAAYGTVLREYGFHVDVASNGIHALRRLGSADYDLVICDIVMPDCDGLEMITQVRRRFPQVRIISISGGGAISARDYLDIASRLGADATIIKPFSAVELLAAIGGLQRGSGPVLA